MIYHIAIHHPHPDKKHLLIESMHRFGAAARTQRGILEVHTLRDANSDTLVGFAIWESNEARIAARPAIGEAIKDDPIAEWETGMPEVYILEEI